MTVDVAIIGCGPVGGVAANLLGAAGLDAVIIEADETPYPLPRAVHFDHEIMRVLQSIGLGDAAAGLARSARGHVHIGADGGVIRYLGVPEGPSPYGWAADYFFYQPELEQLLRDALARHSQIELLAGATVTGLTQNGDGVELVVCSRGSERRIQARYVIACDGAGSTTRKALGIPLDDLGFDEPWLVIDAEVDGPLAFPPYENLPEHADLQRLSVMLCDPDRPTTVVPGRRSHRRWEFMLLPGEEEAAMRAPDVAAALIQPWVGGQSHRIVRSATYRFHALVATQWRADRVFLAGDAAHQTPPFFGQGMCHGIRDVANLAWKLKLVIAGQADPALLESYQHEREPHVRAIIAAAITAGRYICERRPAAAAERDRALRAEGAHLEGRTAADLIAPIAGLIRKGDPRAGERFIQPFVRKGSGERQLLDDVTSGGTRLLTRGVAEIDDALMARFVALGGTAARIGPAELHDEDGALTAWLDTAAADAVLLRPDAYVFGTAPAAGAAGLVRDFVERITH